MSRKIFVDRDLLVKLSKNIDDALKQEQKQKQKQSKPQSRTAVQQDDLTEREKDILEYVRATPGATKQAIVEHFGNEGLKRYSRVPIFKTISDLEGYGLIVVRLDRSNSQIHHLYINTENTFLTVISDWENFKKVFFVLLDRTKDTYRRLDLIANGRHFNEVLKIEGAKFELSQQLFLIYRYFIEFNILHFLFTWNNKAGDQQALERVNSIFFRKVKEIQLRVSESMSGVLTTNKDYKELADILLLSRATFPPTIGKLLVDMTRIFKSNELKKEFEPVLHHLLRLSKGLVPLEDDFLYRLKRESRRAQTRNGMNISVSPQKRSSI